LSRSCTEYQLRFGKILCSFISVYLLISFFPFCLSRLPLFHYFTNLFSDFLHHPFLPSALSSFSFLHFYLRVFFIHFLCSVYFALHAYVFRAVL
jgi:hypothetical protein